jgi:hypothetical protein
MYRLLIFALCSMSVALPTQALFGSDCPEAKESNVPDWVDVGFGFHQDGYRFGFGEARYQDGATFEDLLKHAEQLARQDLVNGIHINIDVSSGISTLVEESESGENVIRNTQNRVETRSKLELPGLPIDKQWQDADSCSVYVQVRIREALVGLVLQRTQAQTYLADARNDEKPIKLRLHAIDEAIRLAEEHEFNKIPGSLSSAQMLREFNNVKSDLERISKRSNHVVYIVNQTDATDTASLQKLRKQLKAALPGSFETGKHCNSSAACLRQAGETAANYASIVLVGMNTSKQNGFWIGDFDIEISLWNLADNRRIHASGNKASRVMNRHKHKLTLEKGLQKWLAQHESILNQYQQAADQVR